MPRSAAACWAEEASTRAAARSASEISCRTASTFCPSTPRARERRSLRAAPTSTRRATCSTGTIRPAARSTRACAPTAATIFSGCRGQCANMCARPPTRASALKPRRILLRRRSREASTAGTKRRRSPARPARCSTTATAPRRSCSGAVSESTACCGWAAATGTTALTPWARARRACGSHGSPPACSTIFPLCSRNLENRARIATRPPRPRSARRRTRRGTPITICAGIMTTARRSARPARRRAASTPWRRASPPFHPMPTETVCRRRSPRRSPGFGTGRDGLSASTLRRFCRRSARRGMF